MSAKAVPVLVFMVACLAGACREAPVPDPSNGAAVGGSTTAGLAAAVDLPGEAKQPVAADDEDRQQCDLFTVALDRFVFNRLQPIVEEATDLLHSSLESSDVEIMAAGLDGAARRLEGLVEELDRMGIPPRAVVDLLLSIRRGLRLYAEAFQTGARGWLSSDSGLVERAADAVEDRENPLGKMFRIGGRLSPAERGGDYRGFAAPGAADGE